VLLSGLYGPYLKVLTRRKSLKGRQKKRCRIGSILAVKHGLKNASENAALDQYNAPRNALIAVVFSAIIVLIITTGYMH